MSVVPIPIQRGLDTADREQLDLLKRTIADGLNDDEFALFVQVAKHTDLDPFRRQIYAIKRWSSRDQREVMTIQTGIDGYRAVAARTGVYAGQDDVIFDGKSLNKQYPGKATVTVYKVVGGLRVPFTASARWDEYCPPEKQAAMWKRMPHNMLGKCAEALALRKAFPEELAGIDAEEAVAYELADRTIPPTEMELTPPERDEVLAGRYQALDVNDKVAFTAWTRDEGFTKPYDEPALDAMAAWFDALEAGSTEPEAEEESGAESVPPDEDPEPTPIYADDPGICQGCGEKLNKTGKHVESDLHPGYATSCEPF